MRFHLVGLPHTETTREYEWCAYTSKTRKFADMMTDRGHEVFLYGGPKNEATCTEHIVCVDDLPDNGFIPEFTPEAFQEFNERARYAISKRIQPRDFVCLIAGTAQALIAHSFSNVQVVEYGVGYGGVNPTTHHVFESYAWMHTVQGALARDAHQADGRFFDAVIPNYFDIRDFPMGNGEGDYLLYFGRLIERKGIQIVLDIAEHSGLPLKVAGAGDFPLPKGVEHCGVVGPKARAKLLGGARTLLAPTIYIEPFGGVVVEAQLCGTPTITTDWGAFTETVQNGFNGWRCRTLSEFSRAVESAPHLSRHKIRRKARALYSLETIGRRYEAYFERLLTLWDKGFYAA